MIKIENDNFIIETKNTGYYMAHNSGVVETLHYGNKIHLSSEVLKEKTHTQYGSDVIYNKINSQASLLHLCLELSPTNKGDFRQSALEIELKNGSRVCDFSFSDARIEKGNINILGLAHAYNGDETLVLNFTSEQGINVSIFYTTFNECDVITKSMRIENCSGEDIKIYKCMSYQLDLKSDNYKLHTFTGAWIRERFETCIALKNGINVFGSNTGLSSHYCNPFFMLSCNDSTEHFGDVYAFNLVYSGSHHGQVQTGPYSKTRIMAGIQPQGFCATIKNSGEFYTPQAVLSYSRHGKNGVSENMHKFVNNHIVRGKWKDKPRPILLNNWEATYFDFNEAKLLKLAKEAKKLGIELFVLDDGWFSTRNNDKSGLGDYNVNTKKLPGGLSRLADKIEDMGMRFGIWFEPEMVNKDSDLYRLHPDWVVKAPGVEPSESRNQLVLDLCRPEVQDYIIENVNNVLKSANISYVKWDMNRPITDCYSDYITEQGVFAHTWIMGLYRVLDEIVKQNPNVLFEGCASGGNRFDLGILCYMPQIWTSDNTDAYERMKIQTGTSYGYPQSTMGCHVSASPNHQTARTSPLETRFDVAAFGVLGYELDLTQLSTVQKKVVADQIKYYKVHRNLLQYGKLIRLISPFNDLENCAFIIVNDDKTEAIVLEAQGRLKPNTETLPIKLTGLIEEEKYKVCVRKQFINIKTFGSLINHVSPVKVNSEGMLVHIADKHYMLPCEDESYCAHGDLLMYAGLTRKQSFTGTGYNENVRLMPDYSARIYHIIKI